MGIILQYISSFFVLVPLLLGIIQRSYINKNTLPVFLLLVITFFIELLNVFFASHGISNTTIFNIYTPLEYILFILFYKSFFDTIKKSSVHYILILFFILITIFDILYANDTLMINNFSLSIESITFILYSLLAFFFIMKRLMYQDILSTSFFWINIAVLIYFAGNLFLFLFSNILIQNNRKQYIAVYNIHSVTNIIYYILISIGFWKSAKK